MYIAFAMPGCCTIIFAKKIIVIKAENGKLDNKPTNLTAVFIVAVF